MFVAVIALLGSGSQLLFTFLPGLKPDPRDSVLAQVSVFAIDPNVSIGNYIIRVYGSFARAPKALQIPPADRRFPGDMVYVRTRVDGFKHRQVKVMATIYNAQTEHGYEPGGVLGPEAALSARTVTLDTPSTSTVQLLWVSSLADEPSPLFVRIEMYDGARMLAVADSPVIRHDRAPLPPA